MLLHMQVVGPYAAAMNATDMEDAELMAHQPEFASKAAARYFNGRKVTIYGGSTEVQRVSSPSRYLDCNRHQPSTIAVS
jgi:hypothetical protein